MYWITAQATEKQATMFITLKDLPRTLSKFRRVVVIGQQNVVRKECTNVKLTRMTNRQMSFIFFCQTGHSSIISQPLKPMCQERNVAHYAIWLKKIHICCHTQTHLDPVHAARVECASSLSGSQLNTTSNV